MDVKTTKHDSQNLREQAFVVGELTSFYSAMEPKYSTLNLSQPPTRKTPPNLTLKPLTSENDVLALAEINDRALDGDPLFKQWMAMFTERTEYSSAVQAVTEAITDPEYRVIKAVIPDSKSADGEQIVGFIHWFCGLIKLQQVDPFAVQPEPPKEPTVDVRDVGSTMAEDLAQKAADLKTPPGPTQEEIVRARRLEKGEKKYVETRNHYITAIRGKRHMFIRRIMVLPEYHGMGIGYQLMRVVTDEADRLKIVCWLFARPGGVGLYERMGYQSVGVTDMNDPEEDFEGCPETLSMIRVAQPLS